MASWTCACGRTHDEERAKCLGCGELRSLVAGDSGQVTHAPSDARQAADAAGIVEPRARLTGGEGPRGTRRSARIVTAPPDPGAPPPPPPAGRLGVRGDPVAPVPPNPSGAPPITLLTTSPGLLQVPRCCCCCLRPPSRRTIDAQVSTTDAHTGGVVSTLLGMATYVLAGLGWYRGRHTQEGLRARLRCPACDTCRRHEDSSELALLVMAAVMVLGSLGSLLVLRDPAAATIVVVFLGWILAGLTAGVAASLVFGGERSPGCVPREAVKVVLQRDDTFRVTFGNRSWGQRVAELNPDMARALD